MLHSVMLGYQHAFELTGTINQQQSREVSLTYVNEFYQPIKYVRSQSFNLWALGCYVSFATKQLASEISDGNFNGKQSSLQWNL